MSHTLATLLLGVLLGGSIPVRSQENQTITIPGVEGKISLNTEDLDLSQTKVTDAGLKELGKLKRLTALHLNNTKVTDAGLKELKELKQLEFLNLSNTQVTDAGLKELYFPRFRQWRFE